LDFCYLSISGSVYKMLLMKLYFENTKTIDNEHSRKLFNMWLQDNHLELFLMEDRKCNQDNENMHFEGTLYEMLIKAFNINRTRHIFTWKDHHVGPLVDFSLHRFSPNIILAKHVDLNVWIELDHRWFYSTRTHYLIINNYLSNLTI